MTRGITYPAETVEEVRRLRLADMSLGAIAIAMKISQTTAQRLCQGIPNPKVRRKTKSAPFHRASVRGIERTTLDCLCCRQPFGSVNRKTNRLCEPCRENPTRLA